ncbi:MAG: PLP-dependent aminotransferase family protein [Actinobacteria bacterium]|nr:PLP-dependent aminotransferase family protein [Actinomycetota bacterium]MBO0787863.1 PLP-dependent aminotransferase family protein [Actinomycetota bacterium]
MTEVEGAAHDREDFSATVAGKPSRSSRGADFLQLDPAAAPARGLTDWLAGALRAAIADGRLPAGASLPATRALAGDLGISRGVIVEAYQRLTDEGLVSARTKTGTTVLGLRPAGPPGSWAPGSGSRGAGPQDGRSRDGRSRDGRSRDGGPQAARSLAGGPRLDPAGGEDDQLGAGPAGMLLPRPWRAGAEIDLSPGVPDLSAFPRAAWLRAERTVLSEASAADLGYGDPRGSERLRMELAGWLARTRGLRARPDDIIVVAGVAQAMALLAQRLRAEGTTRIGVEDPGSRGARDELAHWGLRPVPIPVDEHGLVVAGLTGGGQAGGGLRAALLTPAHQFPTGVVLAPQRRRELVAWAADGGLVIEDDYDAEFRYDRAPVPALQASAPDRIAYAGSTSKTLAPGMRLGWLVPPRRLRPDLLAAKHASDLGCPALPQLVLARLIATGELERHLRAVRTRQRGRRDALLAALREYLPGARVQGIPAGLHLLITFGEPDGQGGDTKLAAQATGAGQTARAGQAGDAELRQSDDAELGQSDDAELANRIRQAGVLVHPLSWHRVRPGPPGLVLGYAAHPPGQLREAARRIAAVLGAAVG